MQGIAFFAIPPARGRAGLVRVSLDAHHRLQVDASAKPARRAEGEPLFLALPASATTPAEERDSMVAPLFEYQREEDGRWLYSTDPAWSADTLKRSPAPICQVWRDPAAALILDPSAAPVPFPLTAPAGRAAGQPARNR